MSLPSAVALRTADGVTLAAEHWPARGPRPLAIGCVVAHGFTMTSRNAHVRRLSRGLADLGLGVLSPDFRGHGRSGGQGTAGAEEIHDISASVAWLRRRGYDFVAVAGWSMGGTAVVRHAGLGGDADAVVSVSAPGVWFERGTRPMRLVHWMFERRAGRTAARYLRGTRVSQAGWDPVPESPSEVAGAIAPRPLLIVHGTADPYFPMRHPDAIAAGAPGADVWIEDGMGHAEVATSDELLGRIGAWILRSADVMAGTAADARIDAADGTAGATAVCDDERRD